MATKKPWAWLDTETTGLKVTEGARVLQVAVHVTDDACRDVTRGGRVKYSSYIKLPPEALMNAAPRALEVNHFAKKASVRAILETPDNEDRPYFACGPLAVQRADDDRLNSFEGNDEIWVMTDPDTYFASPPPHAVWQTVHQMITGCHLVCQNLPFDKPFVENELALLGFTFPCDFRGIEIMSLSNLVSQHLGLTAWGLDKLYNTLAEKYDLGELSAHRADGDVARMMAVYKFARKQFLGSFASEEKCQELKRDLTVAEAQVRTGSSISMELEQSCAALEVALTQAMARENDLTLALRSANQRIENMSLEVSKLRRYRSMIADSQDD